MKTINVIEGIEVLEYLIKGRVIKDLFDVRYRLKNGELYSSYKNKEGAEFYKKDDLMWFNKLTTKKYILED